MNLDEKQRQAITKWIHDGLKLSEIQKRLESDFGMRVTYLDVRLMIDDLKLQPKDPPPPPKTVLATPPGGPGADLGAGAAAPAASGVNVTVDQLTKPGALVSGKVKFGDGKTAEWFLDQTGRLGFAPTEKGYKPAPTELQEFQIALQNELQKMGY
ncbi:MAG TPA: hypothetical protein VH619_18005 [Verrucomicrobiae bacterium]|jgi:hypothetical protein|nr:hypothetical protein [Verrucomicrobiae bacterium]